MKMALNDRGLLDLVFEEDGSLQQDNTFTSVILASVLLNRRADDGDVLPHGYKKSIDGIADDRQGWVGDIFDGQGRRVGSKLWLLANELAENDTRNRAIQYIRDALQWAIDDGHVSSLDFISDWQHQNRLNLRIDINLTNGDVLSLRFDYTEGMIYEL